MRRFSRRTFLRQAIAVLSAPVVLRAARTYAASRVNVADFGARADGVTDVSQAVKSAIAACPKSGAVLVFPNGKYRFTQSKGNAIELMNFTDIQVDGGGSSLLLNGSTCAWSVAGVRGLHMHDFSLDWDAAPFSQGAVVNASKDGKTVDVAVEGSGPVNTR